MSSNHMCSSIRALTRVMALSSVILMAPWPAFPGGLLSDIFVRPISPDAADALDDVHRDIKRAIPLYGEIEDAGSEFVSRSLATSVAPSLAAAIEASRVAALADGVERIPDDIRRNLQGFVPDRDLDAVRWRVGGGGDLSLQRNAVKYGDAAAITLIDVVVFASRQDALVNSGLWAHEMRHVGQFREWGLLEFAVRYTQSYRSVERDAEDFTSRWVAFNAVNLAEEAPGMDPSSASGRDYFSQPAAEIDAPFSSGNMCGTAMGQCQISGSAPAGTPCWCDTPSGASFGSINNWISQLPQGNMCATWWGSCPMMDATAAGSPCACATQRGPLPGQVVAQNTTTPPPQLATICATQVGSCFMGQAVPVGASCWCPTFPGPVWGVAR